MHSDERAAPAQQFFAAYAGVPDRAIRGGSLSSVGVFNDRRSPLDLADENGEFDKGATRTN